MLYLAHIGAFLKIAISAFSLSLFPFLTAEAMVMDPNTCSLLFCESPSGSKAVGAAGPELQQRSALVQELNKGCIYIFLFGSTPNSCPYEPAVGS